MSPHAANHESKSATDAYARKREQLRPNASGDFNAKTEVFLMLDLISTPEFLDRRRSSDFKYIMPLDDLLRETGLHVSIDTFFTDVYWGPLEKNRDQPLWGGFSGHPFIRYLTVPLLA